MCGRLCSFALISWPQGVNDPHAPLRVSALAPGRPYVLGRGLLANVTKLFFHVDCLPYFSVLEMGDWHMALVMTFMMYSSICNVVTLLCVLCIMLVQKLQLGAQLLQTTTC